MAEEYTAWPYSRCAPLRKVLAPLGHFQFLNFRDDVDYDDSPLILGVKLVGESSEPNEQDASLGILLISSHEVSSLCVHDLRTRLQKQALSLPNDFVFCTVEGWLLSREQEGQLKVKQIVTEERSILLKRKYEKPKVGIKGRDGQPIGFIFSDFSVHLNQAKQDVYEQVLSYKGICRNFQFLDPNGWPVSAQQEITLTVMDILVGSCVTVDVKLEPSPKRDAEFSPPDRLPIKRLKGLRELSFRSSKDVERQQSADSSNIGVSSSTAKQILISYVRAEAAEHAVTLKEELSALGFSVYLDVHEISSGVDWQDSLNFAVSNCETFVPLVTHRYGETQWTNREVKLADVLGKFIIPVSFLETWPPRCLAIQFASTQYILWKPLDQLSPDMPWNHDIRKWERKYIQMVAGQIGDRVKKLNMSTQDALERVPSLIKRKTILKSCACVTESNSQAVTSDREGHPLIVVCLHPAEKEFGAQLQKFLEAKTYDVWCTTELQIDYADSIPASQEASSQSTVDNQQLASLQRFQEKADEAGVILFVLSKAFAKSRTCQQQYIMGSILVVVIPSEFLKGAGHGIENVILSLLVMTFVPYDKVFYCEHRKRVIPIQYEQFCMPGWMRMLIGTKGQETVSDETHKDALLCRLRRALDPTARESAGATINEAKISCAVERLRQTLDIDTCVYIAGSTKFYNQSSEAICRSIGVNLAALDIVTLVTGGFYGVGETVGRSFYEESQRLFYHHDTWHILPEYDTQDRTSQAQQNKDGTFQLINYGKTLFLGDSVRERETIVARAFNICILVEGGPGAAHEVDEFSWNDHIVIPVCCTGGAAGGSFNVPDKIFEVPRGVSETNWSVLSDQSASPDRIGKIVAKIIQDLQNTMKADTSRELSSPKSKIPWATSLHRPKCRQNIQTSNQSIPQSDTSPQRQRTSLTRMNTLIL